MLKKALLIGSALGFATLLSMGVSNAAEDQPNQPMQQKMDRQGGDNDCMGNQDCGQKRRMRKNHDNDAVQNKNDDEDGSSRKSRAQRDDDNDNYDSNRKSRREASNWKYDPQRHHRSRHKDSKFRFYLGGYYYDEPYWDSPSVVIQLGQGRVSCGEGRNIVDDSGFNRVRALDCSGRHYTYIGRKHGDTYRVTLNSRSGRIVSVREM